MMIHQILLTPKTQSQKLMTQLPSPSTNTSPSPPEQEGVLGRRLVAYSIDILIIFGFMIVLAFAIFLFGIITFGLGWILYAALIPGTAIVYTALTMGGAHQATIGMSMAGLMGRRQDGSRVDWLTAAIHSLLFYIAAGTFFLLLLDILIGFARADRRLGHDLLTGIVITKKAARET
jgi:uncharacterized RDD family membrane protein YckC